MRSTAILTYLNNNNCATYEKDARSQDQECTVYRVQKNVQCDVRKKA